VSVRTPPPRPSRPPSSSATRASDGLFQGALVGAAFFNPEKATSAGEAAVAFAALLLPYSLVGPFAGVLLDRWSRQRVLAVSNVLRAGLVLGFATLLSVGGMGPTSPAVVALALVVVSLNRFVLSGLSAALPHVVLDRRLVTANSFTTTLGGGAAALGGGLSVWLREAVGKGDAGAGRIALLSALLYVLACILVQRIERDRLGPEGPPPREPVRVALVAVARGLGQGFAHVRSHGQAFRGLAAISAHRFFYGLSFVATLLLYTPQGAIPLGFRGLGEIITSSVGGGLLAALVTPRVTRRMGTQRWVVLVYVAAALAEVAFGFPYTHGSLLVAAFALGFVAQASKICVDTLVQESVADEFRGRVFSLYDTLFNVSFVSAAVLAAVIVPDDGKSYVVLATVAVGYAVTAAVYAVATARHAALEPPEPVVVR
jgi:MFS family permease